MHGRTKLMFAGAAFAALVLAAGVGAVAALATADALDEDAHLARSEQQRFMLPDLDERMFENRAPFGAGRPLRFEGWLDLEAASSYLGLSVEELHDELADGNSLADVARDASKSVDGLVQALVEMSEERIGDAIAAGRLSEEQAAELMEDLEERMRDRVDDEFRIPKPFWFERDFESRRGQDG
jgi:hypothetical protein